MLAAAAAAALLTILVLACGGGDSASPTPTGSEIEAFCRSLSAAGSSLHDVIAAVVPLDEVALDKAMKRARADLDELAQNSRELQGGASDPQVDKLADDITAIRTTLATPDLLPVLPELNRQIQTLADDLASTARSSGCLP